MRACTRAFGLIARSMTLLGAICVDDGHRRSDFSTRVSSPASLAILEFSRAAFSGGRITTTTTTMTTMKRLTIERRSAAFDKSVFIGRARIVASERVGRRDRSRRNERIVD